MQMISIKNAPRTLPELEALSRNQRTILASSLNLLDDPQVQAGFICGNEKHQAEMVYQGLVNYDAANGGPTPQPTEQGTPMTQQMPPQTTPQAGPPMQQPPQYPPPQQPPMQQPPMQQAPPGAPAPQFQPPQYPPQQTQPMPPPPQQPPQQQAPPMQQAPQAPPMMQQAPPMPPPQVPPQAQPVTQAPPQTARQPQTASDPSNVGGDQTGQLVAILTQMQTGLGTIGGGVDAGNTDIQSLVVLQSVTLRTLIALAGVWQIAPEALSKMVQGVTEESLQEYVRSLGGSAGKA